MFSGAVFVIDEREPYPKKQKEGLPGETLFPFGRDDRI
jgi:hypothetical protein